MVQRPAEQGEVAVVMQGGEGTGKGTLAKALMHHHRAPRPRHFQRQAPDRQLQRAPSGLIFLFADEALFAGDRQHVGALKSLITRAIPDVEAKFANAIQAPNFLHVMMASNEHGLSQQHMMRGGSSCWRCRRR